MTVEGFAPAKINLTLHINGQRADGYHLLDSLVVFADVGDRISVDHADRISLSVDGPFQGGVPRGADNLVMRAAGLFGDHPQLHLHLTKNLPPASGIGGGSSDAAATMRAIAELTGVALPAARAIRGLGADMAVCMRASPARMSGIGEALVPFDPPEIHLLLVNPGRPVSTPQVFSALTRKDNPPMPAELPNWRNAADFCGWLTRQRNDLQDAAISLEPMIAEALNQIAATRRCLLSRMSGSGATCIGLYANAAAAKQAALAIQQQQPDWWVVSAGLWRPAT